MLHLRWLLLVSLLGVLGGCDALLNRPGGDFAVTIRTPMPIVVSQRVEPIELVFEVTGCSDFDASIGRVDTGGTATSVLETQRRADGLYVASVPISAISEPTRCYTEAQEPIREYKRLIVRCRDGQREAVDDAEISYATTFQSFYAGRGAVDHVLAGRDPGTFFTVGSGWLSYYAAGPSESGQSTSDTVSAVEPNTRPLIAQRNDTVYLWAGCPNADCGNVRIVDTPTLQSFTPATYLLPFAFDQRNGNLDRASAPIPVPSGVVAMTLLPSRHVALLSQLTGTVLITLVGETTVARIEKVEGEEAAGSFARLGDATVFLTRTTDGSRARMRTGDGTLLGEYPLEGAGAVTFLSLAPSGNQWVYVRNGEVRLASLGADGKPLPTRVLDTTLGADAERFGATWLTNHVGLWSSLQDGGAELHPRNGAGPRVTIALAERRERHASIRVGLGLDDALAIVTPSGLEVFDLAGHSIGGADPFNSACGRPDFQGGEVAVLDGATLAVGGTSRVSLFRPNRGGL
jgi:hypothetical protein